MVFEGKQIYSQNRRGFCETLYWNEGTQELFRREKYAQTPFLRCSAQKLFQLKQTIFYHEKTIFKFIFNLAPPLPKRIYICYNSIVKMVSS